MRQSFPLIMERIAPFRDVPILFTSVTTKQRLLKMLEAAVEVYENRTRHIPTRKLNDTFYCPILKKRHAFTFA